MIEEKLLLYSNKEKQLSYQSRYDSIELKKLSRTVLMQYYVCCCCSMPCVRAIGYIQQGSAARASGRQELLDELHVPVDPKHMPESHKEVISD